MNKHDRRKDYDLNNRKGSFDFKRNEIGEILTIHHTIREKSNLVRIRLTAGTFSECCSKFVAVDHRGNIFIFDFPTKIFCKISINLKNVCIVRNNPLCPTEYLVGSKNGYIARIDIENSTPLRNMQKFSTNRIENISFLDQNILVHTKSEAILIHLQLFEKTYQLDFDENKYSLKFASFITQTDRIISLFTNDTIHIWSSTTLNTLRILHPIRMRDIYSRSEKVDEIKLSPFVANKGLEFREAANLNEFFKDIIPEPSRGSKIKYCRFSSNGQHICLTTIDDYIIILSTSTYEIVKLFKLKDVYLIKDSFLVNVPALMLFVLTLSNDFVLIDINNLQVKATVPINRSDSNLDNDRSIYTVEFSKNGKMFFIILRNGEIKIFKISSLIELVTTAQKTLNIVQNPKVKIFPKAFDSGILDKEVKKYLLSQSDRLKLVLQEFGEYPEKYRHLIWCCLLDLPYNKDHYIPLTRKKLHPCTLNYEKQYQLKDLAQIRHLKQLMSSIIHWCSMFSHCDFMPEFVFPFLKIFPSNPLLTFELMLTIITNFCQLWFEFAPMEPLNYLGIIENILLKIEPELMKFYSRRNITAEMYAWPLMKTAFSEVLDEKQWFQLWDNVISNQPYFLVFCIISYNIIMRPVIMNLENTEGIETFFHDQNIIDVRRLIMHAKHLSETCPSNLHPRRYIKKFEHLPKGFYPIYENYPQKLIELKDMEIETLRLEQEFLDDKIRELERAEIELAKRLEDGLKQEEHEKRLKEVEKLYSDSLIKEEERLACQRKMLLFYQKETRAKKAKVLDIIQNSAQNTDVNLQEYELDKLMREIEWKKIRDETDVLLIDEDLKAQEMNLLSNKLELISKKKPLKEHFKESISKLEKERKKYTEELNLIKQGEEGVSQSNQRRIKKKNKGVTLEETINRIEKKLKKLLKHAENISTDSEG